MGMAACCVGMVVRPGWVLQLMELEEHPLKILKCFPPHLAPVHDWGVSPVSINELCAAFKNLVGFLSCHAFQVLLLLWVFVGGFRVTVGNC